MNRSLIIVACLVFGLVASVARNDEPCDATETVAIPLDQIWAYEMPGTRPMTASKNMYTEKFIAPEGATLMEIRKKLDDLHGSEAPPGFAVKGTGLEALSQAKDVIVDGKRPQQSFGATDDTSLVFFSKPSGSYVHLSSVNRSDHRIEIRYSFVGHRTKEATEHLAIIPLGKLPGGSYTVDVIQNRSEYQVPTSDVRRIVCKEFKFEISENGEVAPTSASKGDYNGDHVVNATDYNIWKSSFGTANAAADGNGNGLVDAADYTVWRDHLGQMLGSGSGATVPEPATICLTLIGLLWPHRRLNPSTTAGR